MADQGKWFKLWIGARRDATLATLSKEDFANWCLLGMYLKEQGVEGMTSHAAPAIALQKAMEIYNYEELINVLKKFPNCVIEEKQNSNVSTVTIVNVTWKNWQKYQGDFSSERVRKYRQRETIKKRREEKRREENKKRTISPTPQSEWFEKIWEEYPQKGRIKKQEAFRRFTTSVLDVDTAKRCAAALDKYLDSKRVKDGFIQNAPTWFGDWMSWENYTDGTANS